MRRRVRSHFLALALAGAAVVSPAPANGDDPFLRRTATVSVVERVGPAVVNITTERRVEGNPFQPHTGDPFFDRFFRDFFEPRAPQTLQSLGSGVIIDRERHVLTNEHVVARASRIRVTLADGREFEATLVGADPNNDLAVLRVETQETLPFAPPGTSRDLLVGEPVIAIGNPFGLSNTVTTGVISAVDRSIRTENRVFHGFLQTDASINPGNSGGPLLNAEGSLIAVNTAIYNGAQGVSFAIPIDTARRVVRELIEYGEVQPVWLGLDFQDLDPALHEVMNLPEGVYGALVNRVWPRSPAARVNVKRGDVVTKVDGRRIQGAREFFEMLRPVTAGQVLGLEIWRDAATIQVRIAAEEIPPEHVEELVVKLLGLKLRAAGVPGSAGYAIRWVRPGSPAAKIGLQPGDVLVGINGRRLESDDSLRRLVLELRGQASALIVVQRGGGLYHVTLPLA
jgi:serine protease Do